MRVDIGCFVSLHQPSEALSSEPAYLAALDLELGRYALLFATSSPVTASDLAQLENARAEIARLAAKSSLEIGSGAKCIAGFVDESGAHGLVEFVPVSTEEAT